jgi:poly(3-hydroxybutyrate) depolymerase
MLSYLDSLLEQIEAEHPIDRDRISLVGISAGGNACWEWPARHPQRFSAVAPIAAGASDLRRLSSIGQTPVWAFANRGDGDIPERIEASVKILNHFGGNSAATIFETSGHNAWNQAFREYNLFDWLTSKSIQDPASRLPPGYRPQHWPWNYLAARGVPLIVAVTFVVIIWLCWRELRHRIKASCQIKPENEREDPSDTDLDSKV